ncbi:uncharacterized protein LOC120637717 isoform X2 [Pararge aegeria]|uniref:uncharacterized protein LOC120637717 isoform X2 n=1 Tax=Pararge aegeria TaxID=116150 RepID=UPI0019D19DEF|nr:uncharacterized protein LOC120637717 isoform X2 [Pararge aegeria]
MSVRFVSIELPELLIHHLDPNLGNTAVTPVDDSGAVVGAGQINIRCVNSRDLKPTDTTNANEDGKEHAIELCQMCQQLGYSCKNFGKKYKPASCNSKKTKQFKSNYSHRKQW